MRSSQVAALPTAKSSYARSAFSRDAIQAVRGTPLCSSAMICYILRMPVSPDPDPARELALPAPIHSRPGAKIPRALLASIAIAWALSLDQTAAAGVESDWLIEKIDMSEPIKPDTSVIVSNLYGDLRIRMIKDADDNRLPLTAIIQHHADDAIRPRIRYDINDSAVISVTYPGPAGAQPAMHSTTGPAPRVDIAVFIPQKSSIEAVTASGLIKIKGVKTNVRARSISGRIWISSSSSIDARSERGDISVVIKKPRWRGDVTIETTAGTATIRLPRKINAIVDLQTSGTISTDYSLSICRSATSHMKYARARIYHGLRKFLRVFPPIRARIRVRSGAGDIILIRPNPELKQS